MEIVCTSSQPLIAPSRLDHNTDFRQWRIQMDRILQDNNVRYVLVEPKPQEPTTETPEADVDRHLKWMAHDFRARHLILSALHQRVYTSYHSHKTAKSLMDALTANFKAPPVQRKVTKLRRYMDQKMRKGITIKDHMSEMRAMVAEIEIEGVKVPEQLQTLMLVNSLPDSLHLAVMDKMSSADSLETVSMRIQAIASERRHQPTEEMALINDMDINIKVARQMDFSDQIGKHIYFDLVDHEKVALSFRVPNLMPFYLFKEKVARQCGIPVQFQRLWLWAKRGNSTYRPVRPLEPREEAEPVGLHCESKAELNLYLEVHGKNDNFIALPERTDLVLLFFKHYDPVQERVCYVGSRFIKSTSTPAEILVTLKRLAKYSPSEEISLYQEFMFEPRVLCFPINMTSTFQESEFKDGDIIWFQKAIPDEYCVNFRNPNVPSFLDYIHGSLVVQFRHQNSPTEMDFSLNLMVLDTYDRVAELVAHQLGMDDPSKIRLTSHNCKFQKPQPFPIKYRGVNHLKEMLAENCNTSYILYYEKLDIPLPQLQDLIALRVTFRHATTVEVSKVVTHTISLSNSSTVRDVLDDLRYKVQLSRPNVDLRLFEVFYHKIYKVYPHYEKIEKLHSRLELWAEEVPVEEKVLGLTDRVIQLCHFSRKNAPCEMIQNFGTPFLLVIHEGETVAEIRARIQHKLHVTDEEFHEWRFAFISHGKVIRYIYGSEQISSWFQQREVSGVYEEYLGIEHQETSELNKQQLTRHDSSQTRKRIKVGKMGATIFRKTEAPSAA